MIGQLVREEVYVREALALGLDRDDAVIRRRLQTKMEFLTESGAEAVQPDDATLEAHLEANSDRFAEPALVAFEQILLDERVGAEEVPRLSRRGSIAASTQGGRAADASAACLPLSPVQVVTGPSGPGSSKRWTDFPWGPGPGPSRPRSAAISSG
jgi:hypothetical protein